MINTEQADLRLEKAEWEQIKSGIEEKEVWSKQKRETVRGKQHTLISSLINPANVLI